MVVGSGVRAEQEYIELIRGASGVFQGGRVLFKLQALDLGVGWGLPMGAEGT